MDANQLNLRDIHLPDPVGWWPPAIGWWLFAVLVPAMMICTFWLYKKITRKTAIKTAIKNLQSTRQSTELNDYQKICAISVLIRRSAISIFPRQETASLTGPAWLTFLDSIIPGNRFSKGPGRLLIDMPYQKNTVTNLELEPLFKLCEDWLQGLKKQP